jgi:MFS superfamily sulfate permease-like transporter
MRAAASAQRAAAPQLARRGAARAQPARGGGGAQKQKGTVTPKPRRLTPARAAAADDTRSFAADALAGASVALVLVPQSVAYATLAGVDAGSGLIAAALAPLPAAALASSRYLQVGPCALMAFQTLAALRAATPHLAIGTPEYAAAATVLALLVSGVRLLSASFNAGTLAEKVPHHVLEGFTLASSAIIASSQLAGVVGAAALPPHARHGVASAAHVITHAAEWTPGAPRLRMQCGAPAAMLTASVDSGPPRRRPGATQAS